VVTQRLVGKMGVSDRWIRKLLVRMRPLATALSCTD